MKRETAQLLLQAMADVTNRLNEALRAVQRTEANEVFVTYRRTVGELMGTMYFDVMSPIYRKYPELEPEELRTPGSADPSRPFKATHRLTARGERAVEVMLYSETETASVAHTREQWASFQARDFVAGPYWTRVKGSWWRDGEREDDLTVEPVE